tara:strand:- start:1244 stop:2182 length:939 start_codon:yes stop_codon:yes gene_type:complete
VRYLEAYDLISTALMSNNLPFPTTEPLIAQFFDDHVVNVSLRCSQKVNSEALAVSGTNIAFTNPDIQSNKFTSQVFKVERVDDNGDRAAIPFVPESSVLTGTDDNTPQIGYYLKTDISRGDMADSSVFGSASGSNNTLTVTSTAHGLDVGDYVIISEVLANNTAANQAYYDEFVNQQRFEVLTTADANTFTVTVTSDATAAAAFASDTISGKWLEDTRKIYFNKSTTETITVYYYALPEHKSSNKTKIDLPDQLITAAMHYTFADIYFLTSKLDLGGPHRNLANSIEEEFMKINRSKEAMQDILPAPLQDFI